MDSADQQYRLLVESIRDLAIFMMDTRGCIVTWNPGAERLTGYTSGQIIGQHASVLCPEAERGSSAPESIFRMAETEGSLAREGWRLRRDGSTFWAHVTVTPVRASSDEVIGFAEILRDCTQRKQANEAQKASDEQFRRLVQGVVDYAIYMLDIDGHVDSWNTGAERIKGYTAEEIIGRHFSTFYTEADRLAGVPEQGLAQALAHGRYENQAWRVRKDGSLFWGHVVIDRIDDDQGTPVGFAKITRDATESRRAEQALEEMRKTLHQAQKMEAIGHLTGGVAHDFNNLLQVISGNLHLLESDVAGSSQAQRRLANAMAGVTRGAKLSSQLLSFGRRQPLAPRVINPGKLVRGMDDLLRRTLGEGIEVETVVSGGLWNTLIDPMNLENALLNLSINARDAMEGQGRLTIEAGNAYLDDDYAGRHHEVKPGQYVLIAVTDTGCGVPPELIEKVFEPFFSTKQEGNGTGLGLSMVYGFVKQSNGHIKIYSEVGHGTTVKIYLPRSMAAEDQPAASSAEPVRGGTESILVVEDDDAVRETTVSLLRNLGYRVLQAHDALSALAVIESGVALDLLFTDVVMPGKMRSPELAQKARQRMPNLAVLFTSGYTENAIVHAGRLDEGVELLSKPYTHEALARKVRQVLAHAEPHDDTAIEPAPGASPLRILFCEDDELIRSTVKDLLESRGYVVVEASCADDAVASWNEQPFDLLITDVGLPEVSGVELAHTLRKSAPALPVIFATGRFDDVSIDGAMRTQTVAKPFGADQLIQAIARLTG